MHDLVVRNGAIVDGTGKPQYEGDIAIADGRIAEIGSVAGRGRREIDADGQLVAPGWVDIHTHYDGQATWDPILAPSSWNGVTTLVLGSCGVGFAPVRPGDQNFLIELMEGIEDIPETALHAGLDWRWETFPQYLDALESMDRVLDVAAQVPHCAVRAYVLGQRAHDPNVTHDEIRQMAAIVRQGMAAGAVGFSTTRTSIHASKHGLAPGTDANRDEIFQLGLAMGEAGHGVLQMASDAAISGEESELSWMRELAQRTGRPISFVLAETSPADIGKPTPLPVRYKRMLQAADEWSREGLTISPQVPCRAVGMLFGFESTIHPFIGHPTYVAISHLPPAERIARLRSPEVQSALLLEKFEGLPFVGHLISNWSAIYRLGDPPNYEPSPADSVAGEARRSGKQPERVALDWMLEGDGNGFLFSPLANYGGGDLEAVREMLVHPTAVVGLSDGGAHCGVICDASMPSFLLTHWVRDRTRGDKIGIEHAVAMQSAKTAKLYGFNDRGTLEVGKKADLNVIDLEGLRLAMPHMAYDLPANGRRILQKVRGYRYTVCSGEVTWIDGEHTGALPGRLVKGGTVA